MEREEIINVARQHIASFQRDLKALHGVSVQFPDSEDYLYDEGLRIIEQQKAMDEEMNRLYQEEMVRIARMTLEERIEYEITNRLNTGDWG